jgi:hypothetical protein
MTITTMFGKAILEFMPIRKLILFHFISSLKDIDKNKCKIKNDLIFDFLEFILS